MIMSAETQERKARNVPVHLQPRSADILHASGEPRTRRTNASMLGDGLVERDKLSRKKINNLKRGGGGGYGQAKRIVRNALDANDCVAHEETQEQEEEEAVVDETCSLVLCVCGQPDADRQEHHGDKPDKSEQHGSQLAQRGFDLHSGRILQLNPRKHGK